VPPGGPLPELIYLVLVFNVVAFFLRLCLDF
jgi:hypothetical protein